MVVNNYEYRATICNLTVEREYSNVFDSKKISTSLIEKKQLQNCQGILTPEILVSEQKNIKLVYQGNHIYQSLFNTYFEKRIENKKKRGDFYAFFNFSQRMHMALSLCDIFSVLNDNNIILAYPSDDMILVDDETSEIYFDLLPTILPRTDASAKFSKELNVKYYVPIPKFYSEKKEKNNIILSLLIFKLLKGNDWICWDTNKEFTKGWNRKIGIYEDNSDNALIISNDFYQGLEGLINKPKFNDNILLQTPTTWKAYLNDFRCLCERGYFEDRKDAGIICSTCHKQKIGLVECGRTHKVLPLLTPNTDYNKSMFYAGSDDRFLFKIHERVVEKGKEYAAFFSCKDTVKICSCNISTDENIETVVEQTNSKGNFYQVDLKPGETKYIRLENDLYIITLFPNIKES